jgi:hypothetical protein
MAWIKRLLQSTGNLRIGDDFGSLLAPARARNLPLPETPEGAMLAAKPPGIWGRETAFRGEEFAEAEPSAKHGRAVSL